VSAPESRLPRLLGLSGSLRRESFNSAVLATLAKIFRFGADAGSLYTLSLFQTGEFAFVLLGQSVGLGVFDAKTAAMLNSVVALSMAITPLALLVYQYVLSPRLAKHKTITERQPDAVDHHSPVIQVGFGRFGNYVGRLLRSQGIRPVVLESDTEHVELLRRLGFEVHYGDATRLELLHAAGAQDARLMIIAVQRRMFPSRQTSTMPVTRLPGSAVETRY